MTLPRLLATLSVLASLTLAGPAGAEPLDWVKDTKGNAYLGSTSAGATDAGPVCPASLLDFDLKWTGIYDSLDGTELTDRQTVYGCTYRSDDADMTLWVQAFQAAAGLPAKAADALSGPIGLYSRKGFTEAHAEATDACEKSIELVTRPARYKESVFDTPDKIKPSSNVACQINRTAGKDRFIQVTAQRENGWIVRTITEGEPKHIELATGVPIVLYALRKPQPDWIRTLLDLDNVV
ncbi:MAG: hypothetical protein R3B94_07245 [Hyphomonas sp.]